MTTTTKKAAIPPIIPPTLSANPTIQTTTTHDVPISINPISIVPINTPRNYNELLSMVKVDWAQSYLSLYDPRSKLSFRNLLN